MAETTRHSLMPITQSSKAEGGEIRLIKMEQLNATTVDLSIVIVSWNTRKLLLDCLQSLACEMNVGQQHKIETFVVDNASTDGSTEMVQEQFTWVRLVKNETNVGFASANNQVIPCCRGRYVLLLNPDTLLKPGALTTLICFMDQHPAAGAAGSRLLNADGTLQRSCHPTPTPLRELWRLFHLDIFHPYAVYRMSTWSTECMREVDTVQGAALILRREAIDLDAMMDTAYFMYSEEVDLCYRIRKSGWQIYWVPTSVVIHYGGQSTKQVAAEMFLHLYRGKHLYFRKNYGQAAALLYKVILLAATVTRLLLSPLLWLERFPRRQQYKVLVGHYRRLLFALPTM